MWDNVGMKPTPYVVENGDPQPAQAGDTPTHLLIELGPADDYEAQMAALVAAAHDIPGIDHVWLNAFSCIRPTDEFAADVGRTVIRKVMETRARHIVIRINAS